MQYYCVAGYDAALYSAATTYYQQQQAAKTGNSWQYKKGVTQQKKQKAPPKPPQLHYCDVCKISCAGPQVCTNTKTSYSETSECECYFTIPFVSFTTGMYSETPHCEHPGDMNTISLSHSYLLHYYVLCNLSLFTP